MTRRRTRLAAFAAAFLVLSATGAPTVPSAHAVDPSPAPSSAPSSSPAPSSAPSPDPSASDTPPGTGPAAAAVSGDTIVPYRAIGYRYSVVAHGAGTGFEAVAFDDSAWATGTAAFGSGGSCALESTVATAWPANTDVLVRRHVALPAGTTGLSVGIAVDNDVRVYWNGTLVGSNNHENCPALDTYVYAVADGQLVSGDNVLAIRAIDRGDQSLLDLTVRATLPSAVNPERFLGQGANPHQNDPTGSQAEPVNTYSGNYTSVVSDLALPGVTQRAALWVCMGRRN